ncbi:hypothetical protein D5S17_32865 [Pseudonocardiaceae bacterium YIM PH 21723]|nr:hypothetical protein D5S17_32865 [Pseudonocardiaceae bacterium YIM PH 21723]
MSDLPTRRTVQFDHQPIARKARMCGSCNSLIRPGERYHRRQVLTGTTWRMWRRCRTCHQRHTTPEA